MSKDLAPCAPKLSLTAQVVAFNRAIRPGDPVQVRTDRGGLINTRTRTEAEVLGGHTAVVWLEGFRACFLLERVTRRPEIELAERR